VQSPQNLAAPTHAGTPSQRSEMESDPLHPCVSPNSRAFTNHFDEVRAQLHDAIVSRRWGIRNRHDGTRYRDDGTRYRDDATR
jgi:hypothetical protein